MRLALLIFLCALLCIQQVHGDEVQDTHAGADVAVEDATSTENMPDPEELNAPQEDLSIADKVAAEDVDESHNDIDGSEDETEAQDDSEEMDTFTDSVQPQPADDNDSSPETYTDTVESQPADGKVDSDAPIEDVESQPADGKMDSDAPIDTDSPSEGLKETLAGLEINSTLEGNSSLSVDETSDKFEPYEGMEIPTPVGTFPGCTCDYSEHRKRWKCKGTIAYPKSVAGDECCCCRLECQWKNRCTNEQCEAIDIDQAEEVAEEEKRMRELMKGADMLLGDDLPGFIVDLGKGRCDQNRIKAGCEAKGLTPLCDHTSYARGGCYSPGLPGTRFHNRHFSHWNSHRQYFGLEEDYMFYGMCFYANNANALAPCNGNSHCWTNGNHRLSPPARVLAEEPVPNIHFNEITNCNGGLGCWRTICVKEAPNNLR